MLESTLRKNRHLQASDLFYSAAHDFSFQLVKPLHVVIRERDKRNALRNFDDIWPCEGAETFEPKMATGRVGAGIGSAQAAAISERVLDSSDAPAFLVKHLVVNHASDGQLRILLDRIIFQVFIATVTVSEIAPVGI